MEQLLVLTILIVITAIYAAFDVFNKRNIPNLFVYASVAVALVITFTYSYSTIIYSLIIAAIAAVFGYIIYKKGFIGGGDFLEFIAISLMLPIQPEPILHSTISVPIPFIVSVLLAAGYVVSIYIPIYYLGRSSAKPKINRNRIPYGTVLLVSYALLIILMYFLSYIRLAGIILLGVIGVASFLIIIYESSIYGEMVSMVLPKSLEQGDMIATNLMDEKDLKYFRKISKNFDRLVTNKLLSEIKHVKKKIPVYRNSVPFALFIFIGIIISLLFGNIMVLILS